MKILTFLSIVGVIINWEAGRLTGNPAPWKFAL
jgi:hypothetical protein